MGLYEAHTGVPSVMSLRALHSRVRARPDTRYTTTIPEVDLKLPSCNTVHFYCSNNFMTELFKKKPEEERRSKVYKTYWTPAEFEEAQENFRIRRLPSFNEFIIRCALGRRADVKTDQAIISQLSQVVSSVRKLHNFCQSTNLPMDKGDVELMRHAILKAIEAMGRIAK